MVLIALLIALSIERLYHSPDALHWQFYLNRWQRWSAAKLNDEKWQSAPASFLRMMVPAFFVGVLVLLLDNLLVTFLVSIGALLLAINCEPARIHYKAYLNAANRGDDADSERHRQALADDSGLNKSALINQSLIWINYRQYLAVLFYFVLFGSFGALVYATFRIASDAEKRQESPDNSTSYWTRLLWFADWIPVRLAGFGLLIVGHFSRALPVWIRLTTMPYSEPKNLLFEVAENAEDTPQHPDDKTEHATCQLKLMRRQQIFWVTVIAVLTLFGTIL
ncbi:regulatory signaling modulator protein AmpE [Idiomarina piscisalsi]|uniref:Regulatory signaling modulator protein AmpE n=1 Tax=Idiomarina piscisalsi TaxID=1096243 RepID=A0ABM6LVI6_9GAMM|nr:beta-lactamase regulator AmpE [Idiomarina piscisalsi]ASG66505.1 regulatory signaling modulator protein AmpE [Idiomarina piscisalsi]